MCYSFRMAASGESFIARMAGYMPAANATMMEKPTAPNTRYAGMMLRNPELTRNWFNSSLDAEAEPQPQRAAEEADVCRLREEQPRDVVDSAAEHLDDADLLGALENAHHHRVHDADGGHQQRDAADCAEQVLHVLACSSPPSPPRPQGCRCRSPYLRSRF